MKTRMLIGLSMVLILAGCATAKWDQRVGNWDYEQAVAELGQPESSETLPDGTRVAEWLVELGSPGHSGRLREGSFATPGYYETPLPREVPPEPSRYLRLTFTPDGKLQSWKETYRPFPE